MKVLSYDEVVEWCSQMGVTSLPQQPMVPFRLRLVALAGDAIAIKSPSEALSQIHLAICLTSSEGFDLAGEYLLVLKDWDIWSDAFESIGSSLLHGIRAKSSEYRSPWEFPGHVFKSSELPDLRAVLFIVLAFQWDAYLLPDTGAFLIEFSHDGWLRGWASSNPGQEAMRTLLQEWPTIQVNQE